MKIISRDEAKSLDLKRYFTGKPCKHSHLSYRYVNDGKCCECVRNRVRKWTEDNVERKRETDREYYNVNRESKLIKAKNYRINKRNEINEKRRVYYKTEKAIQLRKAYRDANRDKINKTKVRLYHLNPYKHRERNRKYYAENREVRKIKCKSYRENNKVSINHYYVMRRKIDLTFKINAYMRNMLGRLLVRSYSDKDNTTVSMLGYNSTELIEHIQSLFKDGMSWDNYGEWHIDHIVPVKWWIDNDITDPSIVNALINLQPLWAKDNLSKGAKI